jgi:hypothetical protein
MVKVFLSYSTTDSGFALRLADALRSRDIGVWVDRWEIAPGDPIVSRLEEGLMQADALILVLSPNSVESPWVERERNAWLHLQVEEEKRARQESRPPRRRLIPVLYRDCTLPLFLRPLSVTAMNEENFAAGVEKLVQAIRGEAMPPLLFPKRGEAAPLLGPPAAAGLDIAPRILALNLLKRLYPPMFQEVLFLYGMPDAYVPMGVTQAEQAIALIKYAAQKEGEGLRRLLDAIYEIEPNFRT